LTLDSLMSNLVRELGPHEGKKVLLTANYIYLNKVIVCLLKYLLFIKHMKGVYIAVDRPYTYTSRLLEKQGIPQEHLFYLDAVSKISSEKFKEAKNAEQLDGPFCSFVLEDAMARLTKSGGHCDDMNFVFLDNLTVMLSYMDEKCLYGFLGQFVIKLAKDGRMLTLTLVDKAAHPNVYTAAKKNCDIEIEIPGDWLRT